MQKIDESSTPKVSFIVIAYNARSSIRSCLRSILEQEVDKEVILVDNNSTDDTVDAVRDLPIVVRFEPQQCRGRARNRGLESAGGQYVAFVDSDVELPKGWTRKALSLIEIHSDVVAVGGPGLTPGTSWVSKSLDVIQYGTINNGATKFVLSLPTMNIMYRGDSIRGLRFAYFWAGEDPEFNFRLSERGYRFLWSSELSVVHHHVHSLGQLAWKTFRYGMWFSALYRRHPKQITPGILFRFIFFPVLVFLTVLGIAFPESCWLVALWLILPLLAYGYVAISQNLFINLVQGFQFVVVHSVKQYAQMLGIWAGVVAGTWRN